jgi:hypothetical protein
MEPVPWKQGWVRTAIFVSVYAAVLGCAHLVTPGLWGPKQVGVSTVVRQQSGMLPANQGGSCKRNPWPTSALPWLISCPLAANCGQGYRLGVSADRVGSGQMLLVQIGQLLIGGCSSAREGVGGGEQGLARRLTALSWALRPFVCSSLAGSCPPGLPASLLCTLCPVLRG